MAAAPPRRAAPSIGLRVATCNVLAPWYADWRRRRLVIADGLRELRPDIVALQEVIIRPGHEQITELVGAEFHVAAHPKAASDGNGSDGTGAALASRWPFGNIHDVKHDGPSAQAFSWGGTLIAEVLAPAPLGPVLVVHHKPPWHLDDEHKRERQAVTAARFVEDLVREDDRHVILVGDLDTTPDAASVRFLTGRQSLDGTSVCYHDAWETAHPDDAGHTFSPHNPLVRQGDMALVRGRRIDYVLVRGTRHGPTLQTVACERIFVDPVGGVQASDHYGLVAQLEVPSRPPGTWV